MCAWIRRTFKASVRTKPFAAKSPALVAALKSLFASFATGVGITRHPAKLAAMLRFVRTFVVDEAPLGAGSTGVTAGV